MCHTRVALGWLGRFVWREAAMKKRTVASFYGKRHQRAAALAATLTKRGLLDDAARVRKAMSDDLKKRRGHV